MLYTFIASAMAVLVPLYLLAQNVDVTWIGIILSLGPLSFMVIRISLASIADEIGTRAIAVLYGASNLASLALYLLVLNPIGFALATLAEGVRNSGFWAVARTEVFLAAGPMDPGAALARFSNMRQLADGAGRLAVGVLLAFIAFQGTIAFFLTVSVALLALISSRKGRSGTRMHLGKANIQKIFHQRPKTFWHATFLQLFVWLTYNMLIGFLLPLYLSYQLGYSYQDTSFLIAFLSILSAVSALIFVRLHISQRDLLLLTFIAGPVLLAFPFFGKDVIPLIALLSLGIGSANIVAEYILVDQVYRSKSVSTDIGVLYAPLKVSEFAFLSLGGAVISGWGFFPLFLVLAVSISLFVIFGRSALSPGPSH